MMVFLLADSFSLGTVLFEINEALSITRYNQVYKSLYSAIGQSQMKSNPCPHTNTYILLSRWCVLHENGNQTSD